MSAVTPSDIHKAESKDIPTDESNISKIFQVKIFGYYIALKTAREGLFRGGIFLGTNLE